MKGDLKCQEEMEAVRLVEDQAADEEPVRDAGDVEDAWGDLARDLKVTVCVQIVERRCHMARGNPVMT